MFYGTLVLLLFFSKTLFCYNLTHDQRVENWIYSHNNFHCGNDWWSASWSSFAMRLCSHLEWEFNLCCARHDDCYDLQLGKKYCDNKFYYCNQNAIEKYSETGDICWPFLEGSYKAMGSSEAHIAYMNATLFKYDGSVYIPIGPQIPDELSGLFAKYYEECEFHKLVVSTCAYRFQHCLSDGTAACWTWGYNCLPEDQDGRASYGECETTFQALREFFRSRK